MLMLLASTIVQKVIVWYYYKLYLRSSLLLFDELKYIYISKNTNYIKKHTF